jgi:hypothetical protein
VRSTSRPRDKMYHRAVRGAMGSRRRGGTFVPMRLTCV